MARPAAATETTIRIILEDIVSEDLQPALTGKGFDRSIWPERFQFSGDAQTHSHGFCP